ncbi:hypothetical protein BIU98_04640 [Curtobacterium sp. MMLR14_010]|nr:hypothetical protein BIU98_04640 [Curtobacterium sp. MMLR14_010]
MQVDSTVTVVVRGLAVTAMVGRPSSSAVAWYSVPYVPASAEVMVTGRASCRSVVATESM